VISTISTPISKQPETLIANVPGDRAESAAEADDGEHGTVRAQRPLQPGPDADVRTRGFS
jgi:hypothetical protein